MLSRFSHVRLSVTPWTVALQASLSMGFSRQEYWSGLPCPPPGDLPNPGIEPAVLTSPALAGRFLATSATKEAKRRSWVSRSGLGRDPAFWTGFQVTLMLLVCGPHPRWGWIVNSLGLEDLAVLCSLSAKLLACGLNDCSIPVKTWPLIRFPGNSPVLSMKVP